MVQESSDLEAWTAKERSETDIKNKRALYETYIIFSKVTHVLNFI